jgi:hypothetical protein
MKLATISLETKRPSMDIFKPLSSAFPRSQRGVKLNCSGPDELMDTVKINLLTTCTSPESEAALKARDYG